MKKKFTVFALSLAAGLCAHAQNRVDVFGEYSYIQFNPALTGLQSRAFNGGGGGATYYFTHAWGIKGELDGYGSTDWTVTYGASVVTPRGIIPAGTYRSNGDMFTYLFGPVFRVPASRFEPFGEVLFGGSNSNGYANLSRVFVNEGATITATGTQHPFTMAVGGGLDLNVSKMFALRLGQVDWLLTRYTNPIGGTGNQNSFRYVGGVVFRFGGQ